MRHVAVFPRALSDSRAFDIAQAMLEGFNRHYQLFRETSAAAKERFERADWHGQQHAQRDRIEFYDKRVDEGAERLQNEFNAGSLSMDTWQQVKLHYIGLLTNHHQPELAETFFNSVTTKILHRSYFNNDFIFVRPAISTEYIENDEPASLPTYRAYYPTPTTLRETLLRIVHNFQLERPFEDLDRDIEQVLAAMTMQLGEFQLPDPGAVEPVLPQQGRLRGGQGDQRLLGAAVRAAHPAHLARRSRHRRGAVRRG
jgi:isocitrate dehydrogenase kinase/phosphatase